MNNQLTQNKILRNIEGKRLLEKTFLEYSIKIIKELEKNPQILPEILDELEITELEFLDYISGKSQANITLYDQTLTLIKTKTKKNIHPKEITKY